MMRFYVTKLNGAGNDFILFDKKISPEIEITPQFVAKICNRHSGIGADGVLVLGDDDNYVFNVHYFNADGSTGSLCANGARCAIRYGKESGRIGLEKAEFIVNDCKYSGQVLDERLIKFNLNQPTDYKNNFKIKAANQLITASYMNTGSPHVVIKIDDVLRNPANPNSFYNNLVDFPVIDLGKEIRNHKDFAPAGTNVNFISIENDFVKIRSYERGVENETLACGTGSAAAALISFLDYNLKPPIKLLVKSGEILIVDFKLVDRDVNELSLTGPAEITFKGELQFS
jgi:diaminopimelate epimerase